MGNKDFKDCFTCMNKGKLPLESPCNTCGANFKNYQEERKEVNK